MVSDRLAYTLMPDGGVAGQEVPDDPAGSVSPGEFLEAAVGAVVAPDAVPAGELASLIPAPGTVDADRRVAEILAGALTYHQAALALLERSGQPDLLLIYYQGIDQISHRFAHCTPPALETCPPEERHRYADVVERYYVLQDRLLGEMLQVLGPETVILILSDHGFLTGADRPRYVPADVSGQPGRWHRMTGLFTLAGPPVRPGKTAEPLALPQVAPTVLAILGLPVGDDMEPPRRDLLRDGHLDAFPVRSIPSWAEAIPRQSGGGPLVADEAADRRRIRELETLGYLAAAGARTAAGELGRPRTVAARVNLASRWIQAGRLEDAEAELERALERSPDYPPAWMGLGDVRSRQGKRAAAAEALGRAAELAGGATADPALLLRWSLLAGPGDAALEEVLDGAVALRPGSPDLRAARGVARARAGNRAGARQDLEAALARAPAHREALAALFALARDDAGDARLESMLRRAVEASSGDVMPHNWLALLLERRGDVAGAERLLREAAELDPAHVGTRVNLGNLLGRSGRADEAAGQFRIALELAPEDLLARLGLATARAREGGLDEARRLLEEAPASVRDDPRLLNTLALVYRDLGLNDRAAAALRLSLERRPGQPQVAEMLRELEGS
jgi:tetratricopeptide (TPR) repeat protein